MHVNYPVRQLFYVGALPVPLQTLRQQRVEHTLYRGERHGSDPVEDWDRKLAADWLDSLLTILGKPVVAGDQGHDLLAPDVLWERLSRGHRLEAPEQVLVLAAARRYKAAIRQHHVGLDQVVDCVAAMRVRYPVPPPSVPARPVVETMPAGTA